MAYYKLENYESDRQKPFPQRITVRTDIETGEEKIFGHGIIIANSGDPKIPPQQIPAMFPMGECKTVSEAFEKFDEIHNKCMEEIRLNMMKQVSGRIIDPSRMGNIDFGNLGKRN